MNEPWAVSTENIPCIICQTPINNLNKEGLFTCKCGNVTIIPIDRLNTLEPFLHTDMLISREKHDGSKV